MTDIHNDLTDEQFEDIKSAWGYFLYNEDGTLNERQVLAELSDYRSMIDNVSDVYYAITGGIVSKPNARASVVLGLHDDQMETLIREIVSEVLDRFSDGESLSNLRQEFHVE